MDSPQPQPPQEARLHFLDYWRIIRIRKAIIITVFLITAIIATAVTFILPVSYSSTAQINIAPDSQADIARMSGQGGPISGYDAYFLQTQMEILRGPVVLGKVIEALNLNEVWGKKYGVGLLKTSETMDILISQLGLTPVRNTTLVDITVYSGDKNEAAAVANAIAKAYKQYREQDNVTPKQGGIKALEEKYNDENAQIQVIRAKVDSLRKELAITDMDPQSFVPSQTIDQERMRQYNQSMMERQTRYSGLKEELDQLKALPTEKLRDVLPGINPDNVLSGLIDRLHEAEQKYATLTKDYSPEYPEVIRVKAMVDEVNRQIDARVGPGE